MSEETLSPSRYLQYLPAIYQDCEFLGRFLRIFEDLLTPVEDVLDQIACYFDPGLTPQDFLPWLALWIDLALDENWPEAQRRKLIRDGANLYRWRGTRKGLEAYLRLYVGENANVKIHEDISPDKGSEFHFTVSLQVEDPSWVEEARVHAIIEAEKPAHTTYALRGIAPLPDR